MKIETKLSIGDKIWYISVRDGCGKQVSVVEVKVQQTKGGTTITYTMDDASEQYEHTEGKYWWATRAAFVKHMLTALKPVGNGKKSLPVGPTSSLSEEFEKFFCDDLPPKKPKVMFVGNEPSPWPPGQVASELISRMKKLPGIRPYRKTEAEMVKDARRNELSRLIDEIIEAED